MKSIVSVLLMCFFALVISTPTRINTEVHLKSSVADILQSQESRWGWGDGGVIGAQADAAGYASAAGFSDDGFGRRDVEINEDREAAAEFAAGGFGGW